MVSCFAQQTKNSNNTAILEHTLFIGIKLRSEGAALPLNCFFLYASEITFGRGYIGLSNSSEGHSLSIELLAFSMRLSTTASLSLVGKVDGLLKCDVSWMLELALWNICSYRSPLLRGIALFP